MMTLLLLCAIGVGWAVLAFWRDQDFRGKLLAFVMVTLLFIGAAALELHRFRAASGPATLAVITQKGEDRLLRYEFEAGGRRYAGQRRVEPRLYDAARVGASFMLLHNPADPNLNRFASETPPVAKTNFLMLLLGPAWLIFAWQIRRHRRKVAAAIRGLPPIHTGEGALLEEFNALAKALEAGEAAGSPAIQAALDELGRMREAESDVSRAARR